MVAFQTASQSRLGWRAWLALPVLALALVFLSSNTTIMRQFTSERRVVSPGTKVQRAAPSGLQSSGEAAATEAAAVQPLPYRQICTRSAC